MLVKKIATTVVSAICLTGAWGYAELPTKEELLDKLYLVSTNTVDRYGHILESGIITDKYEPYMYPWDSYSECPNLMSNCTQYGPEQKNYFSVPRLNDQRGFFYFAPGQIHEVKRSGWNYDIHMVTPLKTVQDKLIFANWREFVTFDELPLAKDSFFVLKEGNKQLESLAKNSSQTIFWYKANENPQDVINYLVSHKGGYLIDAVHSDIMADVESLTFNGKPLDKAFWTTFFKPLFEGKVNNAFDDVLNMDSFYSITDGRDATSSPYGVHRNYGYEFYAFAESVKRFLEKNGFAIEDTGSFQEYVKAILISFDLIKFEEHLPSYQQALEDMQKAQKESQGWVDQYKHLLLSYLGLENAEEPSVADKKGLTGEALFKATVDSYKNQTWEQVFDDMMAKGVYNYKTIHSSMPAFKRNLILDAFSMPREAFRAHVRSYIAFLKKAGTTPPYPLNQMERRLMKLFDEFQRKSHHIEYIFKHDPCFMEAYAYEVKLVHDAFGEVRIQDIAKAVVLEVECQGMPDSGYVEDPGLEMEDELEGLLASGEIPHCPQDREALSLQLNATSAMALKTTFEEVFASNTVWMHGDHVFVLHLLPEIYFAPSTELPRSHYAESHESLGYRRLSSGLMLKVDGKDIEHFELEDRGSQERVVHLNGEEYVVTVRVKRDYAESAFLVDWDVTPRNSNGGASVIW